MQLGMLQPQSMQRGLLIHCTCCAFHGPHARAEVCRLELAPDEATRSLRFTEVRDGNDIRVVVSAVEEGSKAQEVHTRRSLLTCRLSARPAHQC